MQMTQRNSSCDFLRFSGFCEHIAQKSFQCIYRAYFGPISFCTAYYQFLGKLNELVKCLIKYKNVDVVEKYFMTIHAIT